MTRFQPQSTLTRIYLDLDFTRRFAEKLGWLGAAAHDHLLQSFAKITDHPRRTGCERSIRMQQRAPPFGGPARGVVSIVGTWSVFIL